MNLIHGHGYNDGKYPTKINGNRLPHYEIWLGMIRRCYSKIDTDINKFKSYRGCTVSDNFKSYSYFYEWYERNVPNKIDRFFLDKDLLKKGNTVYSEDACTLLPREINNSIILAKWKRGDLLIGVTFDSKRNKFKPQLSINGKNKTLGYFDTEVEAFNVYKIEKEKHLNSLAMKYKNSLTEKSFLAILNYRVSSLD